MANTDSILFQRLDNEKIKNLIEQITGTELIKAIIQDGGLFNTTYQLWLQDGRQMIFQVGPIHPEKLMYYEKNMMAAEAYLFAQMEKMGIPTSHVISMGKVDGRDYMLVDYIPSKPLTALELSEADQMQVNKEVAEAMGRLHMLRGDCYGRVAEVLQGRGHTDWYNYLVFEVRTLMEQGIEVGSFTAKEAEQIIAALKSCRAALSEVSEPLLCHADLWDGNILVRQEEDGWHLAAIIDVDRAIYGDVDFDLDNSWIYAESGLFEQPDSHERRIRQAVYRMMYYIFDAHVWHMQYCNEEKARQGKENTLKLAAQILHGKVE